MNLIKKDPFHVKVSITYLCSLHCRRQSVQLFLDTYHHSKVLDLYTNVSALEHPCRNVHHRNSNQTMMTTLHQLHNENENGNKKVI